MNFFLSDIPLTPANKVDYYPTAEEILTMERWCHFFIAKTLVQYGSSTKSCKDIMNMHSVQEENNKIDNDLTCSDSLKGFNQDESTSTKKQ